MADVFLSSVRSKGDFAGVVEYDGEVGYFYLYDNRQDIQNKVLGHAEISQQLSQAEAD